MRQWLRFWRDERVEIPSSLPAHDALEQLAESVRESWGQSDHGMQMGLGPRVVVGQVSQRRVLLTAKHANVRNSFRPVLSGQLAPVPDGCVLIGTIGWHPVVRALNFALAGTVVLLFVIGSIAPLGSELRAMVRARFAAWRSIWQSWASPRSTWACSPSEAGGAGTTPSSCLAG